MIHLCGIIFTKLGSDCNLTGFAVCHCKAILKNKTNIRVGCDQCVYVSAHISPSLCVFCIVLLVVYCYQFLSA